ncbi:Rab2a [Hexamita inflata]|uniref:Rab2a n=1 Tax=Hexamita inflata TaxID=28002 RepID=A0AA86QK66_9EUKA|nr:Rab2a [Hexamita inflata]
MNYKVILLGDSEVGKTCIARRYLYNDFMNFYEATIATSFLSKQFDDFRLDIWDSAGQEKFSSLVQMYFRNTNIALVVFSIASHASFISAQSWVNQARDRVQSQNLKIFLVGNKSDIQSREVAVSEAKNYAEDNGIKYFECSAKTGDNVLELFKVVEQTARDGVSTSAGIGSHKAERVEIQNTQAKPSGGCC